VSAVSVICRIGRNGWSAGTRTLIDAKTGSWDDGSLLFQTGAENFVDNGMAFRVSNPFMFTLNPGITYAIGAETQGCDPQVLRAAGSPEFLS
jgi:hypothetical protein